MEKAEISSLKDIEALAKPGAEDTNVCASDVSLVPYTYRLSV